MIVNPQTVIPPIATINNKSFFQSTRILVVPSQQNKRKLDFNTMDPRTEVNLKDWCVSLVSNTDDLLHSTKLNLFLLYCAKVTQTKVEKFQRK